MTRKTYRPLNSLSGPKASKSKWILYIFHTLVDLTFLVLPLVLCHGQMSRVKWWLLVKTTGALVYRFVLLLEFAATLATYMELVNRLKTQDYRLGHQIFDPSIPGHHPLPFIYGAFEVVCIFGTIMALTNSKDIRACSYMTITVAISTTISLVKYVTCIYRGCLQCRRGEQE